MCALHSVGRSSPLANQLEVKTQDLDWTLAHFTFVANVTTSVSECDIVHSPTMSVVSCHATPQPALAFVGDSSDLLATYAAFLAEPGSEVELLVNETQRHTVERAFEVRQITRKWQMLYRGGYEGLRPKGVVQLGDSDLQAMRSLASEEGVGLTFFTAEPFAQGPAFGVWERRKLVATGATTLCLPGLVQIGNVITRRAYRRRGYATAIVSALILAHQAEGRRVFVVVDQGNIPAIRLFEKLGFSRERPLYAMRCALGTPSESMH